jgi:hypothetical protein
VEVDDDFNFGDDDNGGDPNAVNARGVLEDDSAGEAGLHDSI